MNRYSRQDVVVMNVSIFKTMPTDSTKTDVAVKQNQPTKRMILRTMHTLVLIASLALIIFISWDAYHNISFIANDTYLKIQFWICLFFMFDCIVEFFMSPKKGRYIASHVFFFLISIPYLNVLTYFDVQMSPEMQYLTRFIPMIRAAYVLMIVMDVLSTDKISSLFSVYIGLLVSTVYIASLMFFIEEHYINPGVTSYWSALWWSFMDVTTVGCNINAMTPTGKVLAVVLAGEGLILFPIFTVYITNALTKKGIKDGKASNIVKNSSNTSTAS